MDIMKRSKCVLSVITMALLTSVFIVFLGCEDEPSMSDLDSYFASHPYVSDPRVSGAKALTITPSSASVSAMGEKVAFKASGGGLPYTWDVANTTCGTITSSAEESDSAVYTVVAVADNTVIVYDEDGCSGIAEITASSDAQAFKIIPESVGFTGTNIVGETVQFAVVGGVPPYGTWRVSFSSLGAINANGLYTVGTGYGSNLVSIIDHSGTIAMASVIQQLSTPVTLSIVQGTSIDCLQSEVINFTAVGGILPYTWYSSKTALGTINASSGVYTGNGTATYGTNIVSIVDAASSVDTITVIHK